MKRVQASVLKQQLEICQNKAAADLTTDEAVAEEE
jgi:hypothetical protein